jgi:Fic family protein
VKVELRLGLYSKRVRLELDEREAEMFRKAQSDDDWDEFLDMVQDDVNDHLDWYLDDANEVE